MQLNIKKYQVSKKISSIELIIAGAGCGKTSAIITKIKNIIKHCSCKPEEILVLTFSVKAVVELKQRLAKEIDSDKIITTATFHAFAFEILKNYETLFLNSCNFTIFPKILNNNNKKIIFNELIKDRINNFLGIPINSIIHIISIFENLDKRTKKQLTLYGIANQINEIKLEFKNYKQKYCFIEYEELIEFATNLINTNSCIKNNLTNSYKYIFIDEFQDLSCNNYAFIKSLLPKINANLFAVGDDWQSIYSFRGANSKYMLQFKDYFPSAKLNFLKINYRSYSEIIKISNNFIYKNKNIIKKTIHSNLGKGGHIKLISVKSIDEEAALIQYILEKYKMNNLNTAILYRNNRQNKLLQTAFNNICCTNLTFSIKMMTIHASKGLEFENVIISGIADGVFPSLNNNLEEERKILYVALTRAKKSLFIICYKKFANLAIFGKELAIDEIECNDFIKL